MFTPEEWEELIRLRGAVDGINAAVALIKKAGNPFEQAAMERCYGKKEFKGVLIPTYRLKDDEHSRSK